MTHFLTKTNIFLNNLLFSQIFYRSRLYWRSLVSCADWLLKCKINLYLADVKNTALCDNRRFCNKLVVALSVWNEWSFGANSLKKMTTWLLTIDWNQKRKINNKTDCTFLCVFLEGTNYSLNGMEVQLSLSGTLFLRLGVAMELQSSTQKDKLRPSLETSAKTFH